MPEYCPATGVTFGYGIAVVLFEGTASYFLAWLQSHALKRGVPGLRRPFLDDQRRGACLVARRSSGIFAGK